VWLGFAERSTTGLGGDRGNGGLVEAGRSGANGATAGWWRRGAWGATGEAASDFVSLLARFSVGGKFVSLLARFSVGGKFVSLLAGTSWGESCAGALATIFEGGVGGFSSTSFTVGDGEEVDAGAGGDLFAVAFDGAEGGLLDGAFVDGDDVAVGTLFAGNRGVEGGGVSAWAGLVGGDDEGAFFLDAEPLDATGGE
jgi:hypothetical protein